MKNFIVEEAEDIDEMTYFINIENENIDEMENFINAEKENVKKMAYVGHSIYSLIFVTN